MLKIDTFTAKRPIFKQNRAKSPKKCSNLFPKNFPKATKKGKTRRFYPNFGAADRTWTGTISRSRDFKAYAWIFWKISKSMKSAKTRLFCTKTISKCLKIRYPRKTRFCYKFTPSPEFPKENSRFLDVFPRV